MNNDLIWVKAKCSDYYKIIKKLELIGISVYDLKYREKVIHIKINKQDFEKIEKYLVSYKFKIEATTGLSKVVEMLKKERIFVLALLIGVFVFLVCKNLIIEVNIIHENKEIRELIKEELNSYDIKALRFQKSYHKLDEIRQEILDKYPDKLDWMEFETQGMIVNVRVEERIITDTSKDNKVCDLVAKKAGVINEIVIYNGETNVQINDYVREGDLLVKGIITHNEEEKRRICAEGEVYATTWYTVNASIPFSHNEYKETGKKKYNLVWENDGKKKEILRSRFENHQSDLKTILKVFDFNLYLETEKEIKKTTVNLSEEEALKEGINKATDSILKKLSDKDSIIDKKVLKKVVNDSTMDIEVFIIVRELISMEKEIVEGIDGDVSENNKGNTE